MSGVRVAPGVPYNISVKKCWPAQNAGHAGECYSGGDVDFLFTGDAEQEAEASMLSAGVVPDVEILKVGHHG